MAGKPILANHAHETPRNYARKPRKSRRAQKIPMYSDEERLSREKKYSYPASMLLREAIELEAKYDCQMPDSRIVLIDPADYLHVYRYVPSHLLPKCPNCNEPLLCPILVSLDKHKSKPKYCSMKCKGEAQRKTQHANCVICATELTWKGNAQSKPRFPLCIECQEAGVRSYGTHQRFINALSRGVVPLSDCCKGSIPLPPPPKSEAARCKNYRERLAAQAAGLLPPGRLPIKNKFKPFPKAPPQS